MTEKTHEQLSQEFVALIFPGLMETISGNALDHLEGLRALMSSKDKELQAELKEKEESLRKAMSEQVQQRVFDKLVKLIQEVLSPDEIEYAIKQETITMKISGVGSRLDSFFEEVLKEEEK